MIFFDMRKMNIKVHPSANQKVRNLLDAEIRLNASKEAYMAVAIYTTNTLVIAPLPEKRSTGNTENPNDSIRYAV